jgi:DNA-binding XRE family transcriptional regulator
MKKQKLLAFRETLEKELKNLTFKRYYEEEGKKLQLGLKIAKLRQKLGLSQNRLAQKVKTSQATIARLESGNYFGFSIRTLEKIAWATNTTLCINFKH